MKSKNLSENILKSLKSSGFDYIDLDTVIPTNLILERSGESFRSLIFSFVDQNGKEICLRPDLTVASCIKYLNQKKKLSSKVFYSGQAFRKVQKKTDKIIRDQIGFEILGSKDEKRDDKQIINTSIKVINKFRYKASKAAFAQSLIKKLDKMERVEVDDVDGLDLEKLNTEIVNEKLFPDGVNVEIYQIVSRNYFYD